ncbi:MAG: hypothetical protein M1826_006784 [Phylliscum demangeonii]|nr:MAG: hypothetical protein M1826_006784 [Phylliscum demangeonii]
MDAAAVRSCILSTLSANADVRKQAELDLKYAEEQPGFLGALLDIIQAEPEAHIALSTAVYLKNRISRGWQPGEEFPNHTPIREEDKARCRDRLLHVLAAAPPPVRQQLIPALQRILQYDFPERWTNFMDITMELLNTNNAPSVFTGLQCLLSTCRVFRFKSTENRDGFDKIVAVSFPRLLEIGMGLVNESSNEAAEMLRIVIKSFKHATFFELPPHLREHETIVGWCSLFIAVVSKDLPPNALPDDVDEREANHWWKSKKWAYGSLNRLFLRYGNPAMLSKSNGVEYAEFSKVFLHKFAPEILQTYLLQIDKWVTKKMWLSRPCFSMTLTFLDECVKPKFMWAHLKPHLENLIAHLLFPILCQSDDDLELFESDPPEYLHRKLNSYEEVSAPDVAATNFLVSLTKSRKKQTFIVLNFINGVVNRYDAAPADQKNPREKEGALRMLGTLAGVILEKNSPIAGQAEAFFVRHVFPEFRSPHGYLRARACDLLEKFEQLDFTDEANLVIIYRNILESLADPELPVRVEAALALQPLIRHDVIRESMQQNIPQIMQQLLKLANEVDVDALANVMEDFVEVFAAQLTPFAVALAEQLRDTYMRIVRELVERNNQKEEEETYGEYLDDKSITALGVLQTIGTLILTLESTPDVLQHLETILIPVIAVTLEHKLFDLFNEVFEIIDSCTYSAKAISPTMWQAFEMMNQTFNSGAELYLEDMLPALDNIIAYGSDTLIRTPAYLQALTGMVREIFQNAAVGGVDRICGCKLAEYMMLHLRGHLDPYVPQFMELAMGILTNGEFKVKSYRIHLMEMVINAIYYNPAFALHVLESKGWTNRFFSLWFTNMDYFSRVHDKKLSIAAIVALLTLRADQVPVSVQPGWPRLLQGIVRLFQTLPAAIRNREEVTKEDFTSQDDSPDEEGNVEGWEGEGGWTAEGDEAEEDVRDEHQSYLEFLNEESQRFRSLSDAAAEDDDLEEENLIETPLDHLEPYGYFRHALLSLQREQPSLYDSMTKDLTMDEQKVLHGVIQQAEANERAATQAQSQSQSADQGLGPGPVPQDQMNGAGGGGGGAAGGDVDGH